MNDVVKYVDLEYSDVRDMHIKFGFPSGADVPNMHDSKHLADRGYHMLEEVLEYLRAVSAGDVAGAADALIDVVYVAKGSAVEMGLPWWKLWDNVHKCNMNKQSGENPARPGKKHDLFKPEGWVPPRTAAILREHGYVIATNNS